jgi:hypothetical protein
MPPLLGLAPRSCTCRGSGVFHIEHTMELPSSKINCSSPQETAQKSASCWGWRATMTWVDRCLLEWCRGNCNSLTTEERVREICVWCWEWMRMVVCKNAYVAKERGGCRCHLFQWGCDACNWISSSVASRHAFLCLWLFPAWECSDVAFVLSRKGEWVSM